VDGDRGGEAVSKVVAIVQARTTSERFPCKIFAALHGKPMLAHVLERAAAIQGVDQVVLAVPENDVRLVAHLWPHVFGGSEKDVLGRYAKCAEQYEADVIVRVTGDCPCLAPNLAGPCLTPFIEANLTDPAYFPACQPYAPVADGWDFEIFTYSMLDIANVLADKKQREHVTTWMRENCEVQTTKVQENYTALKCSVDTREDLKRVELIMNHLEDTTDFSHTATWRAWERAGRP
jgi:spore coat polysaccharide biosynthesis protein SpsF (cytidylyltransferase family)